MWNTHKKKKKNIKEHGKNRSDVGVKSTVQFPVQRHNQGRLQIARVFGMMTAARAIQVHKTVVMRSTIVVPVYYSSCCGINAEQKKSKMTELE